MMRRSAFEPALTRRRIKQKGHEVMEFAILAMLMAPLFGGMFHVGLGLIRSNQANQVTRDVKSMYIKGVDFSDPNIQDLAVRLAGGLQLARTPVNSGLGLVILSQITYVSDSDTAPLCKAATDAGGTCTNKGKFVFVHRLTVGNTTLGYSSMFGSPAAALVNASGGVNNYVTDSRAVVNPQSAMGSPRWETALSEGQTVYVTESYFGASYTGGLPVKTVAFF
jgi:hypothetical protein